MADRDDTDSTGERFQWLFGDPFAPTDPNAIFSSLPSSNFYFPQIGAPTSGPGVPRGPIATARITNNGATSTYSFEGTQEELAQRFSPGAIEALQGVTKTQNPDGSTVYHIGERTVTFGVQNGRYTYSDTDLTANIDARYPRPQPNLSGPGNFRFNPQVEDALSRAAFAAGVSIDTLRVFAHIESSGNPTCQTGSYCGLLQLSQTEFQRYGGGNIFNPYDNAMAAARKLRAESEAFRAQYGHNPTTAELYMIHQQGPGGAAAHMRNPDGLAWQNMYSTAEGQRRGPDWARRAIWGNVPDNLKRLYGSVDNMTSRDFMNMWASRTGTAPVLADEAPTPAVNTQPGRTALRSLTTETPPPPPPPQQQQQDPPRTAQAAPIPVPGRA